MGKPHLFACVIFSVLTIIISFILLIISSICIDEIYAYYPIWTEIYALSIVSLLASIFGIIFAFGLIYVVYRQFPALTMLLSGCLIFVAFIAIVTGIILAAGRTNIEQISYKNVAILLHNYSDTTDVVSSRQYVLKIQQSVQCCGTIKATDWANTYGDGTSTPDSCCITVKPNCGNNSLIAQDKIYLRGCAEPIAVHIREKYNQLMGWDFTIMAFAIVTAILGVIYERSIRQYYQMM